MANPGSYRYGPYHDGPDPLAPPFDVRTALDEMSDAILGGSAPADALREALRRGLGDRQGLDDLMRRVRERLREVRERALHHVPGGVGRRGGRLLLGLGVGEEHGGSGDSEGVGGGL